MKRSVRFEVSSLKCEDSSPHTSPLKLRPFFCLLSLVLSSCSRAPTGAGKQGPPAGPPATPVTVRAAVEKTMPVQLQAVGSVQAYARVSVEARVDALSCRVHFQDGQYVQTGDRLFTLDAAPYEAQLKQAQANLARDQAQLENARRQLERNASVVEKGYVSEEQYDQAAAAAEALAATVKADEAAVESAAPAGAVLPDRLADRRPGRRRAGGRRQPDQGQRHRQPPGGHQPDPADLRQLLCAGNGRCPKSANTWRRHRCRWRRPSPATSNAPVRGNWPSWTTRSIRPSGTIQLRAVFANEDRMALAGPVRPTWF